MEKKLLNMTAQTMGIAFTAGTPTNEPEIKVKKLSMKRHFLLLTLLFSMVLRLGAQEQPKPYKEKSGYVNFGYAFQHFESKETNFLTLKSEHAVSFTWGKTFYLHKKPILKCIKFGIDWTFIDLNLADYTKSFQKDYLVNSHLFQIDAGMHLGLSITLNPVKGLNFNGYCRYAPSFSGFYNNEFKPYTYNYAGFFVSGLGISYKVISLGAEYRWGKAKYEFTTEDNYGVIETHNNEWETKAIRVYLSFRF